jgi:hypothetical protein
MPNIVKMARNLLDSRARNAIRKLSVNVIFDRYPIVGMEQGRHADTFSGLLLTTAARRFL